MTKTRLIILYTIFAMACAGHWPAQAQTTERPVDIVSYYPVPSGFYQDIKILARNASTFDNNPCTIGMIYVNQQDVPMYCYQDLAAASGIGKWAPLSGPWASSSNTMFISARYYDTNLKIGLGTSIPSFKLTTRDQGGIIAKGTFDSGEVMPTYVPTDTLWGLHHKFLWYPRKAALRAGTTEADLWNNDQIAQHSVALGHRPAVYGNTGADYGAILGGRNCNIMSRANVVVGGLNNSDRGGEHSAVAGGESNSATGPGGYTGGGILNNSNYGYVTIGGGNNNQVLNGFNATICGGFQNNVNGSSSNNYSTILGGYLNSASNASWNTPELLMDTEGPFGSIFETYATTGGGQQNRAQNTYATILGGYNNFARGQYTLIAGGNTNQALWHYAVVLGGEENVAEQRASVVAGGQHNYASGRFSAVAGGFTNRASGEYSTIVGGGNNTTSGTGALITGGQRNSAQGDYSWVGALDATTTADADRTFVWGNCNPQSAPNTADTFVICNTNVGINSTNSPAYLAVTGVGGQNLLHISPQTGPSGSIFVITDNGRWGIGRNNPHNTKMLDFGDIANNAHLTLGGAWVPGSSRAFKDKIKPLSSQAAHDILTALEPVTFTYKMLPEDVSVGFVAQDVPDLVANPDRETMNRTPILAVLTKILKEQDQDIKELDLEIEELKTRVKNIKQRHQN